MTSTGLKGDDLMMMTFSLWLSFRVRHYFRIPAKLSL